MAGPTEPQGEELEELSRRPTALSTDSGETLVGLNSHDNGDEANRKEDSEKLWKVDEDDASAATPQSSVRPARAGDLPLAAGKRAGGRKRRAATARAGSLSRASSGAVSQADLDAGVATDAASTTTGDGGQEKGGKVDKWTKASIVLGVIQAINFGGVIFGFYSGALQIRQGDSSGSSVCLASNDSADMAELQRPILGSGSKAVNNSAQLFQPGKSAAFLQHLLDGLSKDAKLCGNDLEHSDATPLHCQKLVDAVLFNLDAVNAGISARNSRWDSSPPNGTLADSLLPDGPHVLAVSPVMAGLLSICFFFTVVIVGNHLLSRTPKVKSINDKKVQFDLLSTEKPSATPEQVVPKTAASGLATWKRAITPGLRLRKEGTKQLRRGEIWTSAFAGDTASMAWWLDIQGCDINAVHERFGTPLQAAAQGGSVPMVQMLIKQGANPNILGGRFRSPLQAAAYSQQVQLVRLLLNAGADATQIGGICGSVVHAAATRGGFDMVKEILDKGADLHHEAGPYHTVLQAVAFHGDLRTVDLLLEKGARVNVQGGLYGTALQAAAVGNKLDIVKRLIEAGAKLDSAFGTHGTALQIACHHGYQGMAKYLIQKGAATNLRDSQRRTLLHEAADHGQASLAQELIASGVDADAQDDDLCTALHYASLNGHDEVIKVLINHGANIHIADKFKSQPLFRAAGMGHIAATRTLVEAGADVNAVDAYGHSALHGPSEADDNTVHEILLSKGAEVNLASDAGTTPLHRAVDVGKINNVKILLAYGARTNIVDNDQNTPLCKAIQRNFDAIAALLLEQHDADVNARGGVALQEAIFRGKVALVEKMLARPDTNINAQGGQFGSAAAAAACNGSPEMLQLLLDAGADVNILGGEYGTALQAAVFLAHAEAVYMLIEHGALVNTPGGRYGCVQRAATRSRAPEARKRDVAKYLEGTGVADLPNAAGHEYERWVLTPGGWTWLPTPGHDQTYDPKDGELTNAKTPA